MFGTVLVWLVEVSLVAARFRDTDDRFLPVYLSSRAHSQPQPRHTSIITMQTESIKCRVVHVILTHSKKSGQSRYV